MLIVSNNWRFVEFFLIKEKLFSYLILDKLLESITKIMIFVFLASNFLIALVNTFVQNVIDVTAAMIILDTYLKKRNNNEK